jgi:hypothetical protein
MMTKQITVSASIVFLLFGLYALLIDHQVMTAIFWAVASGALAMLFDGLGRVKE